MSQHRRDEILFIKNKLARKQPIGDTTQRIDIRSPIDATAESHLRCHEARCSCGSISQGQVSLLCKILTRLDDPEVEHLHEVIFHGVSAGIDVRWLDVSMY